MLHLFSLHRRAFQLYNKYDFLTVQEKIELTQLLSSLGDEVSTVCNKRPLPKLHLAAYHMVQFLWQFGSVGLFTKQPGEAIHWYFSKCYDMYRQLGCTLLCEGPVCETPTSGNVNGTTKSRCSNLSEPYHSTFFRPKPRHGFVSA